jgi:hypothetical protein
MGFGLVNGFIDHLYTRLGITSNYSVTADLHNSQITTAPTRPQSFIVFPSRCLVTALNDGFFSFCAHAIAHWLVLTTELSASNCPPHNISARTTEKTPFFYCCVRVHCRRNVFTKLLPRNSHSADHRKHRFSIVACIT